MAVGSATWQHPESANAVMQPWLGQALVGVQNA